MTEYLVTEIKKVDLINFPGTVHMMAHVWRVLKDKGFDLQKPFKAENSEARGVVVFTQERCEDEKEIDDSLCRTNKRST